MSKDSEEILIPRSQEEYRQSQPLMNSRRAYDYPFSQYNLLVECYNTDCNRINDIHLNLMPESELYRFIFQMLEKPLGKVILAFSLTFLPVLNIFFYIMICKSLCQYITALKVYKINLQLISNPFVKMILSPEVCQIMGRNHWFFQIEAKAIYGFAFEHETVVQLKQRVENGQLKFMVYDTSFLNAYRQFTKYYRLHVTWVILSTLLLCVFAFLTTELIIYTLNKDPIDDE